MDKQTLSNYGWIIILVLILAVLLALASPFGLFVSDAIKGVTGGFWDVNSAALNVAGIDTGDVGFSGDPEKCGVEGHYIGDNKGPHGIPVTDCKSGHTYTCECECWIVPDGGKYYVGVTTRNLGNYSGATKIYNAGEKLPCGYVPVGGDVFVLGDYEYRPKCYYEFNEWKRYGSSSGWGVCVLDTTKASYGEIIENIVNKPVTGMHSTFAGCKSLTTVPTIPNSVSIIKDAFSHCESLTTAPIIPNCVTSMDWTFSYCTSLTTPPIIPNTVKTMECTFSNCTSLTKAPIIPSGVTNMTSTFSGCTNLKTYAGSTDKDGDFSKFIIPNNVTNLNQTFSTCQSLIVPPTIPDSVISMNNTFTYCTTLTIPPTIPSSVTNMNGAFNGCSSLRTAPIIPNSVTSMNATFASCYNLTGTIEINANPTTYDYCFFNVIFITQNITLTGNSTTIDALGTTGINYCTTCNGKCLNNH